MRFLFLLSLILLSVSSFSQTADLAARTTIQHELQVVLTPTLKQISALDQMTLPFPSLSLKIWLNKNLEITKLENGQAEKSGTPNSQNPEQEWLLHFTEPTRRFKIQYSGVIFDPITNDQSSGLISNDGISLFGSSFWYPVTDSFVTFTLQMTLPDGWSGLTQGIQKDKIWQELLAQEEIDLFAAPFTIYTKEVTGHTYRAYLRKDDPQLAEQFLQLTPNYVNEFSKLIGDYPYQDFSIVENFWETGFGLPTMTLLGSSVIRLPFILHSSYPHEILHNWWGNSVYVDYDKGNWSEGLTTYMADHHEQEIIGQASVYRLKTLINYMDYAASGDDFPLRKFISRNSNSTQAVGYGKSLMLFHMLKVRLGESVFNQAIRDFYQKNKFRRASFVDIQDAFESVSGEDLSHFFEQWLDRKGAPELNLQSAGKWRSERGFYLAVNLQQKAEQNYELTIPVLIKMKNGGSVRQNIRLNSASTDITLEIPDNPVRIEVDPDFEVMRMLSNQEKPATLSNVFGTKEFTVLHEENDPNAKMIADVWARQLSSKYNESLIRDSRLTLPTHGPVLVFGDSPAVLEYMQKALQLHHVELNTEKIVIENQTYNLSQNSLVMAIKNSQSPEQIIVWIHLQKGLEAKDFANRLLHYGQFTALVFQDRPNIYKATWLSPSSPLKKDLER